MNTSLSEKKKTLPVSLESSQASMIKILYLSYQILDTVGHYKPTFSKRGRNEKEA